MNYIVYATATGKIIKTGTAPPDCIDLQHGPGEDWMLGTANDAADHIVLDGMQIPSIVPRPTMTPLLDGANIVADGVDVARLHNLPDPCRVCFQGPGFSTEGEVTGSVAEFTTDVPGTHTIRVTAFPYLDWEGEFNAV